MSRGPVQASGTGTASPLPTPPSGSSVPAPTPDLGAPRTPGAGQRFRMGPRSVSRSHELADEQGRDGNPSPCAFGTLDNPGHVPTLSARAVNRGHAHPDLPTCPAVGGTRAILLNERTSTEPVQGLRDSARVHNSLSSPFRDSNEDACTAGSPSPRRASPWWS